MSIAEICPQRVMPVLVLTAADASAALRAAFQRGGLHCAEVTLRTPAAERSIAELARDPSFVVGAGTVLRPEQVHRVAELGARFVVSPGLSLAVAETCRQLGLAYFPGVATPTEIQTALACGLHELKFFPAEVLGGAPALKALAAPFADVSFMPTGGLNEDNAAAYLALPAVAAVGGSWIATDLLVATGDFAEITRRSASAVALTALAPASVGSGAR